MNILALDLSLTATGVAYPDGTTALYKTSPLPDKADAAKARRLIELERRIMDAIMAWLPDVVVVEGFSYGSKGASVDQVYGLGWVVRLAIVNLQFPLAVVPPASVKKYATGSGNAKKPDMRMAMFKFTGDDIQDDNECDAKWMWLMARDAYSGAGERPKYRQEAIARIDWPEARVTA